MKLFTVLILAAFAHAPVLAKCVGKSGETIYSDGGCESAGGTWVGPERARSAKKETDSLSGSLDQSPPTEVWRFALYADDMTGKATCMAISPTIFVGSQGQTFYFVTLRVGQSEAGPIVVIKSENGLADNPESFHVEVAGLGLKVGDGEFVPVTARVGSHLLGFSGVPGSTISRQLAAATSFKTRVRFWPYERTFDTGPTSTDGFSEAFERVLACARK